MKPIGLFILAATTLFPAYQIFTLPNISDQTALFSQYMGLAALILMAWAQIWATRLPGIEALFGGLDRVYILHKWTGILAMAAILLHDNIDPDIRGLGRGTWLNDLAEEVGEISFYGLLILVAISVATFIPYHLWKWTHKLMGALFAAGVFHFYFIKKPFDMLDPTGLYTGIFCAFGLAAYLWTLLPETMRPAKTYKINKLEKTASALAINLTPTGGALKPQAGQFGVFRFKGSDQGEPHPFSFSQIGADGSLRVTIKALGDFTNRLGASLQEGQDVRIQGPFGHFRLSKNKPQVWIAGGIGITPFIAWANALPADAPVVHLFYCVRTRQDAPHLDEIEQLAAQKLNLSLHIVCSKEGKRLSADMIAKVTGDTLAKSKVSFCGPMALRKMLQTDLRKLGVSRRNFHYEEFEFRTGIGIMWLFNKVRARILN